MADAERIKIQCPSCGKSLNTSAASAGKRAKCPGCQNVFEIPKPSQALEVLKAVIEEMAKQHVLVALKVANKPHFQSVKMQMHEQYQQAVELCNEADKAVLLEVYSDAIRQWTKKVTNDLKK